MRVRLAYGTTGLDIEVDPAVTTVVEPVHHRAAADPRAVLRAALAAAGRGSAAARAGAAGADRRDLGLRRHPSAAAAPDDPGDPGGARRDHPPRRRRDPGGDRHAPGQRLTANCGRCSATRSSTASGSSTTTPAMPGSWPSRERTATGCRCGSTARGWTPTCGSRPGSSSRTSSPGSPAARSWSRRAWPAWRPCWCCTTPPGSATRARPGASPRATRSTTTCGRSPRPPGSRSAWT